MIGFIEYVKINIKYMALCIDNLCCKWAKMLCNDHIVDADYLKFKEMLESPGNDDPKTIDEYLEELEAKEKEMKCKIFRMYILLCNPSVLAV